MENEPTFNKEGIPLLGTSSPVESTGPLGPMGINPMVVESSPRGDRAYDIYSLLLKERIVFLCSPINSVVANSLVAQILYLAHIGPNRDINLYINSPGGEVYSGLAIYDTMQSVPCDIATYSVGLAASMATIILASGTKGKRFVLPNSTILMHQPSGGAQGQASDIERTAREVLRLRSLGEKILAKHTGKSQKQIATDSDRDFWLSAEDAQKYGLVDKVLKGSGTPNSTSKTGKAGKK